jgi:thiamine phosphate synthase YjbQ (UPF0047 family)
MRAHTDYLTMNTRKEREIVRITEDVARAVTASAVQDGLCLVSAMHITAGVFVNDDEPGFRSDLMAMLEEIAPSEPTTSTTRPERTTETLTSRTSS